MPIFSFWPFTQEATPRPPPRPPLHQATLARIRNADTYIHAAPNYHRTCFGRYATSVKGWPSGASGGGFLVLERCGGVELEFLGLDRFQPSMRSPPGSEAEKQHCRRMRMLGARWWQSYAHYVGRGMELASRRNQHELVRVTGWPSDGEGVWVLKMTQRERSWKGHQGVANALNMDARCEAIKAAGGVFFENPA